MQKQDVSAVFYEGDDALHGFCGWRVVHQFLRRLIVAGPFT